MSYIIALDEGTTSVRAMVFDVRKNKFIMSYSRAISQMYPQNGWVEENANEIYANALSVLVEAIESVENDGEILGIGITNQRETVIAWEKSTGKPVYNAIVWQCRRTAARMQEIKAQYGQEIHEKTGLICDAYFSASKMKWIIDNVPTCKRLMEKDELCIGTVDSYLIYKLTDGKTFATDFTNASRTMLFNINTKKYDQQLLKIFGIPESVLPEIQACDTVFGEFFYNEKAYKIAGLAGDQQSALIGQGCLQKGESKITYGTGLFMLFNTGEKPSFSNDGLLTTVAYTIGGKTAYAIEGSVFNAGSAVQWLRDGLEFFRDSSESEKLAEEVEDSGGVYVVPAFTGLGAPYWSDEARGIITGITRATTKNHITRAVLESMAFSARELVELMEKTSEVKLKEIRCDGGASANNYLMQFQSDVSGVRINRPTERESTALGAVYLCGLALNVFTQNEIKKLREHERIFMPTADREKFNEMYRNYQKAVKRCIL